MHLKQLYERFQGYFHDGDLKTIFHEGNNLIISMSSAQVDEKEINSLQLS